MELLFKNMEDNLSKMKIELDIKEEEENDLKKALDMLNKK